MAPEDQAGLRLKSCLGYNGNGRDNIVWQPEMGFFAFTVGCVVVIEDLKTGDQRHLTGHVEEISTLAVQSDCQVRKAVLISNCLLPLKLSLKSLNEIA